MNKTKPQIALVGRNRDFFSNPTLLVFLRRATWAGMECEIWGPPQKFSPSEDLKAVRVRTLPELEMVEVFSGPSLRRRYCRQRASGNGVVGSALRALWHERIVAKRQAADYRSFIETLNNKVPSILIGIDPDGLRLAHGVLRLKGRSGVKLGYFSFEIDFWDEMRDAELKFLKEQEIRASQLLDFVLVQDSVRESLLRTENEIPDACKSFMVPVAPMDRNIRREVDAPADSFRIVFSGSIERWSGGDWLLEWAESSMPDGVELEFHSRWQLPEDNVYRRRIERLAEKGFAVRLHDRAIDDDSEYRQYLSRFHMGVALYFPQKDGPVVLGRNIEDIGLASGKFGYYAELGLPVVVRAQSIYEELNRQYRFGAIVEEPKDLTDAIEQIRENYRDYSVGIRELYQEKLNPEKPIGALISYLQDGKNRVA